MDHSDTVVYLYVAICYVIVTMYNVIKMFSKAPRADSVPRSCVVDIRIITYKLHAPWALYNVLVERLASPVHRRKLASSTVPAGVAHLSWRSCVETLFDVLG